MPETPEVTTMYEPELSFHPPPIAHVAPRQAKRRVDVMNVGVDVEQPAQRVRTAKAETQESEGPALFDAPGALPRWREQSIQTEMPAEAGDALVLSSAPAAATPVASAEGILGWVRAPFSFLFRGS
jgi:hypothetical protein